MAWIDDEDLRQIRRVLRSHRTDAELELEIADRVRSDSGDVLWRSLFLRWVGEADLLADMEDAENIVRIVGEASSAKDLVERLEILAPPPWSADYNVLFAAARESGRDDLLHAVSEHEKGGSALVEVLDGDEWLTGLWGQQLLGQAANFLQQVRAAFVEAVRAEQRDFADRTRRQLGKALPGVLGIMQFCVDAGGKRWEFTASTPDALAALQALDSLRLSHEGLKALAAAAAEAGKSEHYSKTLAQWADLRIQLVADVREDTYRLIWQPGREALMAASGPALEQLRTGGVAHYAQLGDALLITLPDRSSMPFIQLLQGAAVMADGVDAGKSLGRITGTPGCLYVTKMHRGYKRPFVLAVRKWGWTKDFKFTD